MNRNFATIRIERERERERRKPNGSLRKTVWKQGKTMTRIQYK